jgi:hypothetical protein
MKGFTVNKTGNIHPINQDETLDLDAMAAELAAELGKGGSAKPRKVEERRPPDLSAAINDAASSDRAESQDAPDLDDELEAALIPPDAEEMSLSGVDFEPIYAKLPIRNPKRTEAFRVHPGQGFQTMVIKASIPIEYGGTGREQEYILSPRAYQAAMHHPTLCEAVRRMRFRLAVNSVGEPFFIVENLQDPTDWGPTKQEFFSKAMREWVTMTSKMTLGMYAGFETEDYGEPRWPKKQTARELFSLTVKARMVRDENHPLFTVVKIKVVKAKSS